MTDTVKYRVSDLSRADILSACEDIIKISHKADDKTRNILNHLVSILCQVDTEIQEQKKNE